MTNLEKTLRGFLWCQGPMQTGKAKVSWKALCVPKYEGGLGLRKVSEMNKALMISHVWSIVSHRRSLWVDWIYDHKLRRISFWDIPSPSTDGGSWRKILSLRPLIRNFIWKNLGDGQDTSAWYDTWSDIGPLSNIIRLQDIRRAGLSLQAKVADINRNGEWIWDTKKMRKVAHEDKPFTSSIVWDTIRSREEPVNWVKVWDAVKSVANMSSTSGSWNNITAWLIAHAKSRSIIHVIGRLVVAATAYFIWQERNKRMFSNHARPPDILSNLIKDTVRSRLWRLKFKKTARVVTTLDTWKIGGDYMFQNGELT
uniref:uncharacterized protein LOC122591596 n=1 Tax=Erigeron canadensis TaxID=72917 RepID=UPI001CB906BC|nr:uncharacterized protein LOC122591596 [Erigeron canadensis]